MFGQLSQKKKQFVNKRGKILTNATHCLTVGNYQGYHKRN